MVHSNYLVMVWWRLSNAMSPGNISIFLKLLLLIIMIINLYHHDHAHPCQYHHHDVHLVMVWLGLCGSISMLPMYFSSRSLSSLRLSLLVRWPPLKQIWIIIRIISIIICNHNLKLKPLPSGVDWMGGIGSPGVVRGIYKNFIWFDKTYLISYHLIYGVLLGRELLSPRCKILENGW